MPLDVFPEFAPPLIEVQTEAPGLSALEVESFVSVPIESALTGVPEVATIRSKSVLGPVVGRPDPAAGRGSHAGAPARAGAARAREPRAAGRRRRHPCSCSPLSSFSRALKIGVTSKTLSQMEMTTVALWTVRPRLMAVPGVANVAVWGQRDRQLQVLVDPDRLARATR